MSEFAYLELSENEDGEMQLRRSGDGVKSDPLVSVKFSSEARLLLGARAQDIARAMIGAGVQMASHHMAHPDGGDDEHTTLH
jgi:hypothetical protein